MESFGFQWHLTDRCNLRCAHCYQDRFDRRAERSLDDLRRMADRILAATEGREVRVSLTGGEPLLRGRALPGLVDHLSRHEQVAGIDVITNGTITSAALVEHLAASPRVDVLKISIESGLRAANDRIRGMGALARVEAGLARLRRAGKEIAAMVTLGRHNVSGIDETVAWARDQGLGGVIFERFVPLGRGLRIAEEVLGPAEWGAAVAAIAEAAGIDAGPAELLPFAAFWIHLDSETEGPLRGARCNLGDGSMALMPDGTVFPCRRLPLAQGNLLEEPFETILGRLAGFRPEALAARLHGEACGRCGVLGCSGCRALAHALSGDPFGDDPCCLHASDMIGTLRSPVAAAGAEEGEDA